MAPVQAEVVACHGCQIHDHGPWATTAGIGSHLVFDPINAQLTFWRVIRDRETGDLFEEPLALPPEAQEAYLRNLELAYTKAGTVIQITPGGTSFPGFLNPLTPFYSSGVNAYHVVHGATLRSQIANAISAGWQGANSNNATLNGAMRTLTSVVMGGAIPGFEAITITFRIEWSDGSLSVITLLPDQTARLEPGLSLDANGNPIPDPSINTDAGTHTYTGEFNFNNTGQMNLWVNQAQFYGVRFVNVSGGRLRLSCVRVGGGSWECRYI